MIASRRLAAAFSLACLASAPIEGALAQAISVKDQTGQEVRLKGPAERIVMIPIPLSSTVIALDGGPKRLVGIHPLAKSAIEEAILGEFFPEARDIPSNILVGGGSQGFAPNVEAIAALRPDVVAQWGDQATDVVGPLKNAGLTTALILYGDEKKARDMTALLGTLMGKTEKLNELIAWRDATTAAIEKKVAGIAEDKKPKVLYLLRALGELRVSGTNTYNDFYIKLAGGRNAAAEIAGQKPVNAEQIAAWNPDVILLNGFESDLDVKRIYDDPVLGAISAAKGKRVYKMPIGGYRWDPPSQESPLTWMWLANLLHPELFAFDVRAEIKTWYGKLYAKVPTDTQIDAILRMAMNRSGAGYARFAAK